MANQQTGQLVLNFFKRKQTTTTLIDLATILQRNEQIPDKGKKEMHKKVDSALLLFENLSPLCSGQPTNDPRAFEAMIADRLTVELTTRERTAIMAA